MSWMPSSLGAEPKKIAILAVLLVAAPAAYYMSSGPSGVATTPPAAPTTPSEPISVQPMPARQTARSATPRSEDFRPSLKLPEGFDLSKVDPTLRTDLLAKVREVGDVGGTRSLFDFYIPPPPPPPKVEIKPAPPAPPKVDPPKISEAKPPAPPPPPPIPLKYVGFEGKRSGGKLRAVLVDGEDTFVVAENDLIRNRYRIVRVGTTSAEVEDTVAKNTQTLRIVERYEDK